MNNLDLGQEVVIRPKDISKTDYEVACSILASSVRRLFEQPGINKEYEEWLKSDEAKRLQKKEMM